MSVSPALLSLRDVGKCYPEAGRSVPVLEQISLKVQAGDFVGIAGPSGSGKTTLLNVAGLLDPPTSGAYLFNGKSLAETPEKEIRDLRAREMGMIFQRFFLLPQRRVIDNVAFRFRYLGLGRQEAADRARALLKRLGMEDLCARRARSLSGGEMQRVAIARALVHRPRLLLADEPTGNLDAASAARVFELFQTAHAEGVTILLASHDPELLAACDQRYRLEEGRLHSE